MKDLIGIVFAILFVVCGAWVVWDPSITSMCLGLLGMYGSWKIVYRMAQRITNPMYKPGDVVYLRANQNQDITKMLAESRILNMRKGGRS